MPFTYSPQGSSSHPAISAQAHHGVPPEASDAYEDQVQSAEQVATISSTEPGQFSHDNPAAGQSPEPHALEDAVPSATSPNSTHQQGRKSPTSVVRFSLGESTSLGPADASAKPRSRRRIVRGIRGDSPSNGYSYIPPEAVRQLEPEELESNPNICEKQDAVARNDLLTSDVEGSRSADIEARTLTKEPEGKDSLLQHLENLPSESAQSLVVSEGNDGNSHDVSSDLEAVESGVLVPFKPEEGRIMAIRPNEPQRRSDDPPHDVVDALRARQLASRYADICEYNMRAFRKSAQRKELLCLANIKFRYGARPSSRFLSIFDIIMGYLYPTPRRQKKLKKDTRRLLHDWDILLSRYELVEKLTKALFDEALDTPSDDIIPALNSTISRDGGVSDRYLPSTTNALITGALMHLDEVRIQDAVLGRRAEALDAQWDLLLAQLKQLDQVDLLKKRKTTYDP